VRAIELAREYARLDALSDAADKALLAAEKVARAAGVTEKKLSADPDVHAAALAHQQTIRDLFAFTIPNGLDGFGDPRRPGTGLLGEISIAQIPRNPEGRGR
jgi:hypothetical protein